MMITYDDVNRKLSGMKIERQSYEPHWLEIQDFFLPRRGRWLGDNATSRGKKANQKLVDPTPRFAVRTAAAGIHAGSTNPSSPWFKLTTPDPELNEYSGVARWLYAVENRMRDVFERSNLYSILPMVYGDSITFGVSPMMVLEHPTKVIHCVPNAIGSYYLGCNYEGTVDTKYCEYKMTAEQMKAQFVKLPKVVESALQNKSGTYFDVTHVIEPNNGRLYGDYSSKSMPWRSCYLYMGEQLVMKESGFEDNPLSVLRWEVTEITDPYGSSPGMDALGAAKAMQLQQKRKAQAIDKHIDPPMVGDPTLQNQPSTLLPGGVTWAGFTPSGAAPRFQPAYVIKPEIQGLLQDIQDVRDLVNQAMYVDLFMAITRADPRNASVPEIAARREEQVLALGPMLQNHRDGLVKPLIDRTFGIMLRQGRLPPPPDELQGVDLKVEMTGILAQTFKAISATNIERFGGYVAQMAMAQANAGQAPTALDKFDVDQGIDEYAMAIGVPPTVVRSDDDVAMLRQQRQEQQAAAAQQQQDSAMAQQASQATQAAKNLSQTQVGGKNALEAIVGQ